MLKDMRLIERLMEAKTSPAIFQLHSSIARLSTLEHGTQNSVVYAVFVFSEHLVTIDQRVLDM